MANLIIKSSADNLVLQGSDASPAITVGATGTTTFAENATLSGTANNLGTVATMTLPTASATALYPVGHIVQTSTLNKASTNTNLGTGTVGWTSTVVTHAITPIYSNSAIVVHANFIGHISDASGDSGYNFRWLRAATGIADSYPAGMYIGTGQSGSDAHSIYKNGAYNTSFTRQHQLTLMDENVTVAATPVTYTLQVATYLVDAYAKFGSNTWTNYQWSIFFQEIKR
jgi:hypothetical protein